MKKRILSALAALMLLCFAASGVYALEVPDLEAKGSIHLEMKHGEDAVPGGTLTLYRVADIHVENGADYSFRYTDAYAACEADLADLASRETAQTIADYTAANAVAGVTAEIAGDGTVVFADLELGLYLLVQETPAEGFSPVSPFLVSVPTYRSGSYIYDVNATPKVDLEPAPTVPTEPTEPSKPTKPTDPELPQTGQNNWPVPVLAVAGLSFFALGVYLWANGRKHGNES